MKEIHGNIMHQKEPVILTNAGAVIAVNAQTLTEVSGHYHQSSHLAGGGGSGHVSTTHVDMTKGCIERYSDADNISFSLQMEPFLRMGDAVSLLYVGDRCIGVAKLKTGQWRANLSFNGVMVLLVVDWMLRGLSLLSLLFVPLILGFVTESWGGGILGVLLCIGACIASAKFFGKRIQKIEEKTPPRSSARSNLTRRDGRITSTPPRSVPAT